MKNIFFLILFLLGSSHIKPQKGSILVTLKDKANSESIPFANVVLYSNKIQVALKTTDLNGNCKFDSLPEAKYDVKGVYVGYTPNEIKSVVVRRGKLTNLYMFLNSGEGISLQEVEIVTYQIPLIDADTKSGQVITRESYQNLATKDINSVAATTAGIFRKDKLNVRGARANSDFGFRWKNNNSERYEAPQENCFKRVKNNPLSTFSSDVDVASYANIRRIINQGSLPPAEAVRIEEMVNYFKYDDKFPENDEPFSVNTELSECPWNVNHQLLRIGIQGKKIEFNESVACNLVFLVDVSGSMSSQDKLPLLQSALILLTDQLKENDRVAIVAYAGNAGLVLPSTKGKNKQQITDAIKNLSAGGSTAGGEGILLAYEIAKENFIEKGNNRVILATDGDFNVGVTDDNELVKLIEEKRESGVFLTVLGFGTGNYQDAKMEKLADKGNGNYAYIDNIVEAKKVLVKELAGTLITIAKDVKIQIEFNPETVKEYRLIGYENRILNDEDFNDDKKDAGEVGAGHSVTALYEIISANSKESEAKIDELKYQKNTSLGTNNEICTIKLRYKEPKENTSKLITHAVVHNKVSFESASENFRFCAAVAEFGLLLKESKYKSNSSFGAVIKTAKSAKGTDEDGYRSEFIKLCETAELMAKN